MTDSDINSLKCYLSNVLEPALKQAKASAKEHETAVATANNPHELHYRRRMKSYYDGQITAYRDAIKELVNCFPDELRDDDYPEDSPHRYDRNHDPNYDPGDERGDWEHERRRDAGLERRG